MKKILKNYKSTLILLLAIIIGAIVGIIFKEDAKVLSPLGDIFINILLVVIVPLVFLTITTSIAKMSTPKRLGKIMITTIVAFLVTSIVAVIVGFITTYNIDLVKPEDTAKITSTLVNEEMKNEDLSILERTADVLTVKSFNDLLTTDNLIALLVFSILFGLALNGTKEKGEPVRKILESLLKFVLLASGIMYKENYEKDTLGLLLQQLEDKDTFTRKISLYKEEVLDNIVEFVKKELLDSLNFCSHENVSVKFDKNIIENLHNNMRIVLKMSMDYFK